jgi:hypothetical protein
MLLPPGWVEDLSKTERKVVRLILQNPGIGREVLSTPDSIHINEVGADHA